MSGQSHHLVTYQLGHLHWWIMQLWLMVPHQQIRKEVGSGENAGPSNQSWGTALDEGPSPRTYSLRLGWYAKIE